MGKIKILNEVIEYREQERKVDDLLYWVENPRVYSEIRLKTLDPTQKDIEETMIKLENVKRLRSSIKANGGLTHPVFVRNGVVVEGNSRLAAYRLLCRVDKIKWGKIRCFILPDDLSDDLVFALISSIHMNGVTEWTPFEQAAYLFRHAHKSKKPIEAIAKDCGLTPANAKLYVRVYETMMGNDDTDQSKWSYYLEMLKNKHIENKSTAFPSLNLIDTLCQQIKDGVILNAKDLRKVGKLAAANSDEATSALKSYLEGTESLDSAVSKVSEDDKKKHAKDVTCKFREQLTDKDYILQLMDSDDEFKYEIERVYSRLRKLFDEP